MLYMLINNYLIPFGGLLFALYGLYLSNKEAGSSADSREKSATKKKRYRVMGEFEETEVTTSVRKQLKSQNRSFYKTEWREHVEASLSDRVNLANLIIATNSFVDVLTTNRFCVSPKDLTEGSLYKFHEDPLHFDITVYENGFSASLYLRESKQNELISSATFIQGKTKTDNLIVVHQGFIEMAECLAVFYDSLVNFYNRDFPTNQHTKRKGGSSPSLPKEKNTALPATSSPLPKSRFAPDPDKSEDTDLEDLLVRLQDIEERSLSAPVATDVENNHRIHTILKDCENLLVTYRALPMNNVRILKQVLFGLRVAIEKLDEILGAGMEQVEVEVIRQVEILKQR